MFSADPDELQKFLEKSGAFQADLEKSLQALQILTKTVTTSCGSLGVEDMSVLNGAVDLNTSLITNQGIVETIQTEVILADVTDTGGLVDVSEQAVQDHLVAVGYGSELGVQSNPMVEQIAAEYDITYEQAEFQLMLASVAELDTQIDMLPSGSEVRTQLLEERVAIVDHLTGGHDAFTIQTLKGLDEGKNLGEAMLEAGDVAFAEYSSGELLELIALRIDTDDVNKIDLASIVLQEQLLLKAEELTTSDAGNLDMIAVVISEEADISYNEALAHLKLASQYNQEVEPTKFHFLTNVPVSSVDEVALILQSDRTVFDELDTAYDGKKSDKDGKIGIKDINAVLNHPDTYSDQARRLARYLKDYPNEWAKLDTAKSTQYLSGLDEGNADYVAEGGDDTVSFEDIEQLNQNSQIFASLNQMRVQGDLLDLDVDGVYEEEDFQASLDRIKYHNPQVGELLSFSLENELYKAPDTRGMLQKIGDSAWTVASFTMPIVGVIDLVHDPRGFVDDRISFAKGVGDVVVGIGQLGWDIKASNETSVIYYLEMMRVGGDKSKHRGLIFRQAMPEMAKGMWNAGLSVIPGTNQFDESMERVRYSGSWDSHAGLGMAKEMVDWETFLDDPGRWAGRLAPELVLAAFSGGGGAISRVGTTGQRVAMMNRKFLQRSSLRSAALAKRSPLATKQALLNLRKRALGRTDELRFLADIHRTSAKNRWSSLSHRLADERGAIGPFPSKSNKRYLNQPKVPVRKPHGRHNAASRAKAQVKEKNTLIDPSVDVQGDVKTINDGLANRNSSGDWIVNGRRYGVHQNGTLFPIEGPGLLTLSRPDFRVYNDIARAGGDLSRLNKRHPDFSDDRINEMYELWQGYRK